MIRSAAASGIGRRTGSSPGRHLRVVLVAVVTAVAVNLVLYAIGRLAGGTFRFTAAGATAEVDGVTVAGFTAIPLTLALLLAAIVVPRWPMLLRVGLVVAPVLELGSILAMTLPADFDAISKITLALCHVTLVPVSVLALLAMRTRRAPDVEHAGHGVDATTHAPVGS